MSFQNIKAGDTVVYTMSHSPGKTFRTKVNPLLIFADHVVVNRSTFGQVVNEFNFVKVIPRKR